MIRCFHCGIPQLILFGVNALQTSEDVFRIATDSSGFPFILFSAGIESGTVLPSTYLLTTITMQSGQQEIYSQIGENDR